MNINWFTYLIPLLLYPRLKIGFPKVSVYNPGHLL